MSCQSVNNNCWLKFLFPPHQNFKHRYNLRLARDLPSSYSCVFSLNSWIFIYSHTVHFCSLLFLRRGDNALVLKLIRGFFLPGYHWLSCSSIAIVVVEMVDLVYKRLQNMNRCHCECKPLSTCSLFAELGGKDRR